ncbi:MAG: zinc ribbon domain-containing protein [Acidimicrobiales bacterium]
MVVEDLNVAGTTTSSKGSGHWRGKAGLDRAALDAAPGELCRQLAYKARWHGPTLVVADRWYPSSKTCSRCKAVKAELSLAERTYRCEHCGVAIDRDANAAANLAALVGALGGTGSGPGTSQRNLADVQGDDKFMPYSRWSSTNCEDATSPKLDRTATATRERVAPKPVFIRSDRWDRFGNGAPSGTTGSRLLRPGGCRLRPWGRASTAGEFLTVPRVLAALWHDIVGCFVTPDGPAWALVTSEQLEERPR